MAKRKKAAKVQSRAKPRRASSAKRGKTRKAVKAAKRTVAKTKSKPMPRKKAARKLKQPIAPVIEAVAVEANEQPVPVTAVEETQQAS